MHSARENKKKERERERNTRDKERKRRKERFVCVRARVHVCVCACTCENKRKYIYEQVFMGEKWLNERKRGIGKTSREYAKNKKLEIRRLIFK